MSNPFKIELASKKYPVSFIAFDILQFGEEELLLKPLLQRKEYLEKPLSAARHVWLYLKYMRGLGQRSTSLLLNKVWKGLWPSVKIVYTSRARGQRTGLRLKSLIDEDFVICGYIFKDNHMISLILGQYSGKELVYKGHVTLGVGGGPFTVVSSVAQLGSHPFSDRLPEGNEEARWIEPKLVCTVKYMEKTAGGGMRQPVFKGLRYDKAPLDCIIGQS